MKLKGPLAKLFGFSDKDFSESSTGEVSAPFVPNLRPDRACYGLAVPFEHQPHINLCGDACLNMVFGYRNLSVFRTDLRKNPRGALTGLTTDDIIDRLRKVGLPPHTLTPRHAKQWTALELAQHLFSYGPLICKGARHFVLLVAVSSSTGLAFHDPWRGQYMPMSLDDFNTKFLDWSDPDNVIGAGIPRWSSEV